MRRALLALVAATLLIAAAKPSPPVTYTAQQAWEGRYLYIYHCAKCHAGDLSGAFGPALAGTRSHVGWETPKVLWDFMHPHMPIGNAMGLPVDDYVKITAYLMQMNGRPAGRAPLTVHGIETDTLHIDGTP